MKCSNCGADIPAVNVQYSWKQLIFIVPILLVGFWPLAQLTIFRGDVTKDLVVRQVDKKLSFQDSPNGTLVVTGIIKNLGNREWSGVTVEAEFFDEQDMFLDEASEFIRSDILAEAEEHFKIQIRSPRNELTADTTALKVKISGGRSQPF
ncbi:MAG: FxLYD domain-containing protein [Pirellulales bacterium]|nr:FxLYD domain-containing protein [Pirellulales bacterium]